MCQTLVLTVWNGRSSVDGSNRRISKLFWKMEENLHCLRLHRLLPHGSHHGNTSEYDLSFVCSSTALSSYPGRRTNWNYRDERFESIWVPSDSKRFGSLNIRHPFILIVSTEEKLMLDSVRIAKFHECEGLWFTETRDVKSGSNGLEWHM